MGSKSANSPLIYDFHAKSLKDSVLSRRDQASDHNFKSIPAEIVGIGDYESMQSVDVKFLINDIYVERDNITLESMTLKKVFVSLPSAGGYSMKFPVSVGDKVVLCWSHRDLGEYLDSDGGPVDVNINEIAQIEDCWVLLGFGTRKNHTKPSKDNFVFEGPNTTITITPEGDVTTVTSGVATVQASEYIIDTDLTVTGNFTVNGTSALEGTTTIEERPFLAHTHNSSGAGVPN